MGKEADREISEMMKRNNEAARRWMDTMQARHESREQPKREIMARIVYETDAMRQIVMMHSLAYLVGEVGGPWEELLPFLQEKIREDASEEWLVAALELESAIVVHLHRTVLGGGSSEH